MEGYRVKTASLLLLAAASSVFAGNGPDYNPEAGYPSGWYGGGHPAHSPVGYPVRAPRVYLEKARYEDGYLLRVHTEGIKAEDIEVLADRRRLRLRSEISRQNEWHSEQPYRRSSMSSRGSIRRTISLPHDADASKLTTAVEDGTLEIRIPRLSSPGVVAPDIVPVP